MTKKSAGRLQRDALKEHKDELLKDNVCWDDLNSMYNSMCELLVRHVHISNFAANKDLIDAVNDKTILIANIRMFANDLRVMNDDLKTIHNMHAGKSGGTDDPAFGRHRRG